MKTIKGIRNEAIRQRTRVYINGKQLSLKKSLEYVRIGYSGFEWGYGGAGPQQLSFAILLELTNEYIAHALCGSFAEEFVAKLPKGNFEIPIEAAMRAIGKVSNNPSDPLYFAHKEKYKERYQS